MKILHLPTDVGGNAWGLSRGERSLGLDSDVLTLIESKMGYPSDIALHLEKLPKGWRPFKLIKTFFEIRRRYSIFHFNYGRSLIHRAEHPWLYLLDLPFYPKSAKLFVTYNGCDARQKYPTMQRTPTAACHQAACYGGMCNSGHKDRERQRCIEIMSRYVNHIWALNPDLLYFLPKEKASFLPYTICHPPQEPSLPKLNKKLTVVHAPTNQAAKGSPLILSTLNALQKKYPDLIEVCLIENLPYSQVLEKYRQADLAIDQILIGWYGAFAVEMMLMGKPIIARIATEDLHFIPSQMANDLLQTIIHADPQTLYSVLEQCLHQRSFLKQRAEASIAYATKWHNPSYVASLTKEKYEI